MKTEKSFSLGAVLSVTTGLMLAESFGDVHEVFDHFYPGIMTLGLAMMADSARDEVHKQHPELADIKPPALGAARGEAAMIIIRPWLRELEGRHGASIPLLGAE